MRALRPAPGDGKIDLLNGIAARLIMNGADGLTGARPPPLVLWTVCSFVPMYPLGWQRIHPHLCGFAREASRHR